MEENPTPFGTVTDPTGEIKRTTKDLFHHRLHSYVITDAIKDENVLKFAVEYLGRYQRKPGSATEVDIEVEGIDTRELMESPQRLEKITDYIIGQHPVKTRNKEFTAMMCVGSVDVLIKYYELFAKRKAEGKHKLRVATIFSYTSNEEALNQFCRRILATILNLLTLKIGTPGLIPGHFQIPARPIF